MITVRSLLFSNSPAMPSSVPLPRHQGLGGLIKKIAKTRQLKTEDVQGVIADLHAYAIAEVKKGRKVYIPQLTALKLDVGRPVRFRHALNDAARPHPDDTL